MFCCTPGELAMQSLSLNAVQPGAQQPSPLMQAEIAAVWHPIAGLQTGLGAEVLIDLPSYHNTDFELALGASVVQGFQATEPSLDLRASIRTLPTVSVYVSRLGLPSGSPIIPYFGAGFGVADLWNARGYTPDGTGIPVKGEALHRFLLSRSAALRRARGLQAAPDPADGVPGTTSQRRRVSRMLLISQRPPRFTYSSW
jgi:hypothetical protein